MSTTVPPTTFTPTAPSAARWEDFIDIIHAPRDVFRRRRRAESTGVAVVVVLLSVVLYQIVSGALDGVVVSEADHAVAALRKAMPELSGDQVDRVRSSFGIIALLNHAIAFPVLLFAWAGLLWTGARLQQARLSFAQAFTISTFGAFPFLAGQLLAAVQGLALPAHWFVSTRYATSLGPARLFASGATPAPHLSALAQVDLTVLWMVALWALALSEVAGMSRRTAWHTAGGCWLAMVLLGALRGVLQL